MTANSKTSGLSWTLLCLFAVFVLAFLPRYYSVQSLGWGWDHPGSFTLINFDEAGSCRAALDGFDYSTFIGEHTLAIARALDKGPPADIVGDARAVKAYCHSASHIQIARLYSALLGAATVVLLAIIALQLVPGRPAVAWTAAGILGLSGFHISESHSGTVDVPSVFFIYLFIAVLVAAVSRRSVLAGVATAPLLAAAMWAKFWFFAAFAYLALLPRALWSFISHGMSTARIALVVLASAVLMGLLSTSEFRQANLYPVLALWYLVIPWRRIHRPMIVLWLLLPLAAWAVTLNDFVFNYTTSGSKGIFGTAYGAIGWHKWLRNPLNVPLVLLVGLGLPAFLFLPAGIRQLFRERENLRAWLCLLLPVLVFALYMAFVAPVTYYRHYLALLPAAALLAALGLFATGWGERRWFLVLFFLWPAALAWDFVSDYHRDPRIELRQWFVQHDAQTRVFASYYVNAPRGRTAHFQPHYGFGDAQVLREAQYLILSENWYDTSYANELNGPLVNRPHRLVKTKPEFAAFYRMALEGRHGNLVKEQVLEVKNFMPELVLHKAFYGTFQLFVGDLVIFRVVDRK